ncbi:hypothetical protein GIB67_036288 [Kingdonia uniflora]|uniref:Uncharacterized protein n=1 Tax=Kingdonia uniflora TaxID=39325 RepID=A0A7J7L3P7_9MAGN|nr:hypothetical protein GIB67_036288 [Kingdonia uniflora]
MHAPTTLHVSLMAFGSAGRRMLGPLLIVNFVVYLIVLGVAGWSIDKYIDGEEHHHHLGGNAATSHMLVFSLIAGVSGACSVLAGFMHMRYWRSETLAIATSPAILSWAITVLAFGLACKEISMGGHRGRRLQTLEAFIMISTLTQLIYLALLLHSNRFGPIYGSHGRAYGGMGDVPQTTSTPAVV